MMSIAAAKERLDYIINIGRVDLYKPIHIAEVLYRSRTAGDVRLLEPDTYSNPSLRWRDAITLRLSGKVSTSSARYQHDVWNPTAMPPDMLAILDRENKKTNGAVERYIYMRYSERQGTVASIIAAIEAATPETFQLSALLDLFVKQSGIRRSIDKAYEIVAYSLFETVVTELNVTVKVSAPPKSKKLLKEFSDLTRVLLGLNRNLQ
ncbi:MAG: HaeII family restriction endonuclease, partial [Pyrinomonadaceae bacterium]|nr:HaeII family restriction endonuclease [Pyrinomonadaceae bacterium]